MLEINLSGKKRTETGKKASKEMRKEGFIPCNLYGEKKNENGAPEALAFAIPFAELRKAVYTPNIYVINLNIDGENAVSLNCRTTEGRSEGAIMGLLKLTKGFYEVELVHTKPGIEIDYVGFSRIVTTSTGMRFFHDYGEPELEHPRFGKKKKTDN